VGTEVINAKGRILTIMAVLAKMALEVPMPYAGHVLLVDEASTARPAYARALTDEGFLVTKARGRKEALRRLEKEAFDVLLADVRIPEKDGLALLEDVHALSPHLPVIVLVSELNNQFAVDAAELGAVQYLQKPFDQDLLRRSIRRAVGLKQVERDRTRVDPLGRRGEAPVRMNATKVKNQMGHVLDRVIQGEIVVITRHETPKAAVIPMAELEKLSRPTGDRLSALSSKYDGMLARMQTAAAGKGMKAAFDASPKQLAQAALALARQRG
jgi:prevent-host-death family protein